MKNICIAFLRAILKRIYLKLFHKKDNSFNYYAIFEKIVCTFLLVPVLREL